MTKYKHTMITLHFDALSLHTMESIIGDYCAMMDLKHIDVKSGNHIVEIMTSQIEHVKEKYGL